jgi:hypothetical protein
MTSHELAKLLLESPDIRICVMDRYEGIGPEWIRGFSIHRHDDGELLIELDTKTLTYHFTEGLNKD